MVPVLDKSNGGELHAVFIETGFQFIRISKITHPWKNGFNALHTSLRRYLDHVIEFIFPIST